MDETMMNALRTLLWPDGADVGAQKAYWLLDGARERSLADRLAAGMLQHDCLFAGALHPRLRAAAPYIVYLDPAIPEAGQLLRDGWGKAWGILVLAPQQVTLAQLRRHFKKFLRVRTEDGKELAFRFYDPRVLNVYLPTCNAEEFTIFLGPATALYAERDEGNGVRVFAPGAQGMWGQDRQLGQG